ncbi:MAG: hypothetical protein ACRDT2_23950 [Natronosporangium sp.]
MKRTTVTLTGEQEQTLDALSRPGAFQEAARAWAAEHGIELSDSPAEAALVRVLIDAGVEHLRTPVLDAAYTELATFYQEEGLPAEIDVLLGDSLQPVGQVEG